jgi:hypothetical protein
MPYLLYRETGYYQVTIKGCDVFSYVGNAILMTITCLTIDIGVRDYFRKIIKNKCQNDLRTPVS